MTAELTPVDPHQCKYRTAIEEIDALDAEDFKVHQDHLPPAFRVPDIREAFRRVCIIVNRVLYNVDSEDAGREDVPT